MPEILYTMIKCYLGIRTYQLAAGHRSKYTQKFASTSLTARHSVCYTTGVRTSERTGLYLGFDQIDKVDLGTSCCPRTIAVRPFIRNNYCSTNSRAHVMVKNEETEFRSAIEEAHATDR